MVGKRRKRIPQPWMWALAGAALGGAFVFVFVVAPSLLIGPPPKGLSAADELKARNDVRTTLVQALAGLAVAGGLIVTYRTYQQNRAEQDRTYERELYAKAVEQLGHEKAPVRLGALYSLERLAQDKPERRQVIVNVICAYLRMPFASAPPAIKAEPGTAEDLKEPGVEANARIDEVRNTWRQERQVRSTAQRILTEHLCDERAEDKRSIDRPSERFWPGIRLDLAGATLFDFNLRNGTMADAHFTGATFKGNAWFTGATCSGFARFDKATFDSYALFDKATFSSIARFDGATFNYNAKFTQATFSGDARFTETTFNAIAAFDRAISMGNAEIGGAIFTDEAEFDKAKFSGRARFDGATFGGDARFDQAIFTDDAKFDKAKFSGRARFDGAAFSGGAGFDGAAFGGIAGFKGTTFRGDKSSLSFKGSRVLSLDENVWPTGWCSGPDGNGGYTVVRAKDGRA